LAMQTNKGDGKGVKGDGKSRKQQKKHQFFEKIHAHKNEKKPWRK
jgi:hypothetical protein